MKGVTSRDLLAVQKAISQGRYREHHQAHDWAGKAVAQALGLNLERPTEKRKTARLLSFWLKSGALKTVEDLDQKGNPRRFVQVGEWVND